MTTDMALSNMQLPAHVQARLGGVSKLADAIGSGLGTGGTPRISIKGGRFRQIEEGTETVLPDLELKLVIVGAGPGLAKTWYAKQWSPDDEPQQPDCFSIDGAKPDVASTMPQNDLCSTCPQNAWGSRITPQGTEVKACADHKRLAVVSASDVNGPVYLLQVTPAALRGLQEYRKAITMRGIPFEIIVTRVGFDTSASFPKLTFNFGGFLSAEDQAVVDQRIGSNEVKGITGETPTFEAKQLAVVSQPTPVALPTPVAPAPAPKPAPVAATPKPAPAPAQAAKGFGKPAVAETAAPDSLLADIEKLLSGGSK